jgi:isopentenyl diphosphate isomerase/L-lactate dehydrogenase-like FMN-dependent dehydrogenase
LDRRAFVAGAALAPALSWAGRAAAQSAASGPLPLPRLLDLEAEARKAMGEGPFAFVSGGAGSEWCLRENRRAFERWVVVPDYLAGRAAPDTSTTVLGQRLSSPIVTAPMGAQILVHVRGDAGMAEGTSAAGALMMMSGAAVWSIEQVAAAAKGPKWYQLYLPDDPGLARSILQRAKASGFTAVAFTLDALGPGNSEAFDRTGFNLGAAMNEARPRTDAAGGTGGRSKRGLSFADLEFVVKEAGLPVILKGVLTPELARRAVAAGCAGVQVSNHGGRQLDSLPAALEALPAVVEAVGDRATVLMDGGVRRGTDVFKALALGAKAVAVGRPLLYGLALGGPAGVKSVYDRLKAEFTLAMQGACVDRVDQISARYVRRVA